MEKIQVRIHDSFGHRTIQPVCDKAFLFCELLNSKSLSIDCLKVIEKMGYKIQRVI